MRFTKLIALAFATAALAVPAATAGDGHGHGDGKGKDKQKRCHAVMVVLKGTFVGVGADGKSFQMKAEHANKHGRPYLKEAQPLTLGVDDRTRFGKDGKLAKLTDLAANDQVLAASKACKSDLRDARNGGALPALTARFVLAKTPGAPEPPEPTQG